MSVGKQRFRQIETGTSPLGPRVHPDEISKREFPRSHRGFDADTVRAWLVTVQRAYEDVQQELHRIREERDRLARTIEQVTERPARAGLRSTLAELRLKRGFFGYSTEDVERLLDDTIAEMARLETQAALLMAENEDLRRGAGPGALRELMHRLHGEMTAMGDRIALLESMRAGGRPSHSQSRTDQTVARMLS